MADGSIDNGIDVAKFEFLNGTSSFYRHVI